MTVRRRNEVLLLLLLLFPYTVSAILVSTLVVYRLQTVGGVSGKTLRLRLSNNYSIATKKYYTNFLKKNILNDFCTFFIVNYIFFTHIYYAIWSMACKVARNKVHKFSVIIAIDRSHNNFCFHSGRPVSDKLFTHTFVRCAALRFPLFPHCSD